LLCLKLGNSQKALDLVQASLKHLRGRHKDCTFLCGDCGPLAVAALAYNRLGTQYITQNVLPGLYDTVTYCIKVYTSLFSDTYSMCHVAGSIYISNN